MNREPWLAVALSSIFPGLGHFYARRFALGVFFAAAVLSAFAFACYSFAATATDSRWAVYSLALVFVLHIANLVTAFRAAQTANDSAFETQRRAAKDPWLAAWLSSLFPGLGHFYLKQWGLGAAALLLLGVIVYISIELTRIVEGIGGIEVRHARLLGESARELLVGLYCGLIIVFAFRSTPTAPRTRARPVVKYAIGFVVFTTVLRLGAQYSRTYFLEPFKVTGRSMAPTLEDGDRIVVDHRRTEPLKRGDLITFYAPSIYDGPGQTRMTSGVIYVKRLVAFGGETVELKADGSILINDEPLTTSPFNTLRFAATPYGAHFAQTNEKYFVKRGTYFVLGDNSAHSSDSRMYGSVDEADITGVAYKLWWPFDRARPLP